MVYPLSWENVGTGLTAIGAFGTASFGVVESLGKMISFSSGKPSGLHHYGLPYAGFGKVKKMMAPLAPALKCTYGEDYLEIIAQQYYADRSAGTAPDLIRQGVRLGLPFLNDDDAAAVIGKVWSLGQNSSMALATALKAPPGSPAAVDTEAQALAGRFAGALDARINAAFAIADQTYETTAKTAAGAVAVVLALAFNCSLGADKYSWFAAVAVGLVAVPLAPVAKDLSSYLQNAFTAFKSISGKA
jgi:hypothetical protein